MKDLKIPYTRSLVYVLLALLIVVSCKAHKNKNTLIEKGEVETHTKHSEEEWITLFDGSSFNNWRGYLSDRVYPEWTIEEGAMAFTPGKEGEKNIITKEKFSSFILSLEWKISEGGNSGVFWGIFEDEAFPKPYETGPEIQVLDNERHPDAKVNPRYHQAGALYDLVQPTQDACKPAGEWNEYIIKVDHKSNSGSVTLNGVLITEFPVHGEEWDALVAQSKFKNWKGFGKYKTGHIGLQDHSDKVWYRNIKIKKL
ncbi:DUF1080 domain-containing protein [Tamlana sp. 2201CG12-4]|uniref:3-keto-disaccharide hydrolase n=1 Tax=Tamlana sp. 2201CG12-4 TaxID=3112582 RepID=UPI002DBACFFE|nr:DUF1080 domain-containing protein [Tamlana sp. 2201CG12-4]MEC3905652.1 DUF1080 domain-containing protein [Tamlana sp. 2201CG12-4]